MIEFHNNTFNLLYTNASVSAFQSHDSPTNLDTSQIAAADMLSGIKRSQKDAHYSQLKNIKNLNSE